MNDSRIEELLRMAVEADDFELEAEERPAVLARVAGGRIVGWGQKRSAWVIAATAACAALAFAGAWFVGLRSVPRPVSPHQTPIAVNTDKAGVEPEQSPLDTEVEIVENSASGTTRLVSMEGSGEQSVVLAIFHDPYSGCRCVQWREHDWSENRCLNEVPSQELTGVDVGGPCMPSPRQKLLVALAGPERALPTTDVKARELAECILGGERMCDSEGSCYAQATRECLPDNVSFKIEAVAANR